jgi:hypothetical protein
VHLDANREDFHRSNRPTVSLTILKYRFLPPRRVFLPARERRTFSPVSLSSKRAFGGLGMSTYHKSTRGTGNCHSTENAQKKESEFVPRSIPENSESI